MAVGIVATGHHGGVVISIGTPPPPETGHHVRRSATTRGARHHTDDARLPPAVFDASCSLPRWGLLNSDDVEVPPPRLG